jgi:Plasmid pRiA4b ORF-3-like protein
VIAPLKKQPAPSSALYELKITLRGSKPPIWRRLQVPGSIKLNRLHEVFQVAMGWTDSHLHQFMDPPMVYSVPSGEDYPGVERLDERRFRLADLGQYEKASFLYEYDFGDGWQHDVVVEKIVSASPEKKRAVCLAGENACPPEDCGGIWGYYELLETVNNPKHKAYQEMLDWLGEPFDPGRFDLQEVNATLRRLKP